MKCCFKWSAIKFDAQIIPSVGLWLICYMHTIAFTGLSHLKHVNGCGGTLLWKAPCETVGHVTVCWSAAGLVQCRLTLSSSSMSVFWLMKFHLWRWLSAMYSVGITKIKGGSKGLVATIPVKSLWPPSEESPPPLPLFQCCSNDVNFSFDIFSNLQNNIGQGVWGKKEATVQCYCLRLYERVMPNM